VPSVFCCKAFADENVAKVAATVVAQDLDPESVSICFSANCAWYFIVKSWPAAARMKFIFGPVQGSVAPFADILATFKVIRELASKRHFRSFVKDDMLFFRRQ
tara:strand:+ start:208 stop:516 length:309 start_codon:yes stop_codon:yes gene_type:complete